MTRKPVILAVDDEPGVAAAIMRDLRKRYGERYWVISAGGGAEALVVVKELVEKREVIALVVADQRMPGVTGIELHDRLAARSPEDLAKLVLITGDTASPEVAEFVARLKQPLVQKPFDMRALADLLDRTIPTVPPVP